jgi:acetyl esterase/lipase
MLQIITRTLSTLASLPALLIWLRAPSYRLWMARVGITEWGHYALPLALPLLSHRIRSLLGPFAMLWLGAALIMREPLRQARIMARTLPQQLDQAFPTPPTVQSKRALPIDMKHLWFGIPLRRTPPQRVCYASHPDGELILDLYTTQQNTPAPLVVVIHGGAWQGGDPTQLPDLNYYLAEKGYVVAAISYRLAPAHPFPAAYDDTVQAITFLKQHAHQYAIDPTRIILLGRSAGGHLALLAGYRMRDPAIRGVVAFYAPTDMHFGFANPSNPRVLDSHEVLTDFLAGDPTQMRHHYDAASPIQYVGADTPPTLLIHGTTDEMVWSVQSHRLARQLAAAQRPHMLLELPWATHGCDANFSGPSGQLSTFAIERFLRATLAAEP